MAIPEIKSKMLVTKDTFYGYRSLQVNLKQVLNVGQAWDYDIAAVLGANAADYDLPKTEVEVFVIDSDAGSVTNGYYVEAGAVAGIGFKEDGKVRVVNQYTDPVSLLIRVYIYRKQV